MDEDNRASRLAEFYLHIAKRDVYLALKNHIVEDEDIRAGLTEFLEDKLEWVSDVTLIDKIQKVWNPEYQRPPRISEPGVCYGPPPEPEWFVGLTPAFERSIKGVDKTLQGRILQALVELCNGPMTARGDTIKPLEGDKAGLWRYRIGDYRLVYRPDTNVKKVILVSFNPRGSAYS